MNKYNEYNDNLYCQYCNKKCKNLNSLTQHEIRCKLNPNKITLPDTSGKNNGMYGKSAWNKGLNKNNDNRVKHYSDTISTFYSNKSGIQLKHKFSKQYKNNDIFILAGRKGGKIGTHRQQKRSKNEIKFCELCEEYFGKDKVFHNEPIFNGWDADIIIPELKIAVLWNGIWHYKKVTKLHDVKKTQDRDKIKIQEIKSCGYIPYVIKDIGSYDINKVKNEFNIFLEYINNNIL